MKAFPVLNTKRLTLKQVGAKDIPTIVKYAGNPKIAQMTLNIPHPYAEKDAIFWINKINQGFEKGTTYTFGIRLNTTDELIGAVGIHPVQRFNRAELGYWIAEPFWNAGYASEAARCVLEFGFRELGLHKIYATHLVENPASGKVMAKCGMIQEADLKDHVRKGDKYYSLIQYRLTKEEFEQSF